MKVQWIGMGAVLVAGLASGATFTDDFNRADVGPTTDGSVIGANYVNSITESAALKDWQIFGNELVFPESGFVAGGNAVLYNTTVQTLTSATGSYFSVEADVTVDINARWAGVAFNYQDKDNFYALRISQSASSNLVYQILQVVGGVAAAPVISINDNDPFVLGQDYHVSVAYDQITDNYIFLVRSGATILNDTTTISGTALGNHFEDGYGGVYASGINMNPTYDNLRIESDISLPSPHGSFVDDFERADVGPTTNGQIIGNRYVNSIGSDALKDWQISSGKLLFPEAGFVSGGNAVLYNTSVQTLTSATGAVFSIEADVTVDINNRWVGVVFNYQNPTNFYGVRISQYNTLSFLSYQFVQVVDGALTAVFSGTGPAFTLGNTYNVSVSYEEASDTYTYLVKDGETVMNGTTNMLGAALGGGFENGYGGVYCSGINQNPTFDNLSIVSVDPTAAIAPATIISFSSISGHVMRMVVNVPDDADNYYPKATTDFVNGTWAGVGHSVDGLAPFITTNLAYSTETADITNTVIYVQSNDPTAFFGIGEK